jgi:D-serine deaminase-like pyridoxal phosphate-dependent protein
MSHDFTTEDPTGLYEGLNRVPSPSLLFDAEAIDRNIQRMIDIVGGRTELLRPHMKTHKCAEILKLQLEAGITRIKCATIAEAELAAMSGVTDVLLSYPLVGPNAERFAALGKAYPDTAFATIADSPEGVLSLASFASPEHPARLFLDLDCGMHRTGIGATEAAVDLVKQIQQNDSLEFAGVHAYDGHIHDAGIEARRTAFAGAMEVLGELLQRLDTEKIEVPLIVSGGSPTFALHAEKAMSADRAWQCSPGTTLLWDAGYGSHYPDLAFDPAAFLLARVVSHPGETTICIDLGNKAVSAENPIENRVRFPGVPVVRFVGQSEEHLVIEILDREKYPVGTVLLGIPYHVCPSVALYQRARILRSGAVTEQEWEIAARDRRLTV